MKAIILIAEDRRGYRERLLSGLQRSDPNYEYIAVANMHQINNMDKETLRRITLILAAEPYSSYLSSILPGVSLLHLTDMPPVKSATDPSEISSEKSELDSAVQVSVNLSNLLRQKKPGLSRQSSLISVRETIAAVTNKTTVTRAQDQKALPKEEVTSEIDTAAPRQSRGSLGCLLFFSRNKRIEASATILKSGKAMAHDMIYLPLMPLYDMAFSFRTGSSQTLGDLLLMLKSGRIPQHEDLGNYLYLHNDGYYTFPCPDRADDLICADNRSLRELILLLKKYIETRTASSHALVEISALALERHAMLAALCDYLVIETPTKTTDAALIAQQELALFLSKLPSSCDIYEGSDISKLSEEAPWFY